MKYGLTIDPGLSSGICLFARSGVQAMKVLQVWQISGGAQGLADWCSRVGFRVKNGVMVLGDIEISDLVVEKFTPRQNSGFNLTLKSVEPLVGEGVLIGRGFGNYINWAQPSQQYFMGDPGLSLAQKKKASREFLKTYGMHVTGKAVGQKDADDAISATLHSVAYMRRIKHMPTITKMFGDK